MEGRGIDLAAGSTIPTCVADDSPVPFSLGIGRRLGLAFSVANKGAVDGSVGQMLD